MSSRKSRLILAITALEVVTACAANERADNSPGDPPPGITNCLPPYPHNLFDEVMCNSTRHGHNGP